MSWTIYIGNEWFVDRNCIAGKWGAEWFLLFSFNSPNKHAEGLSIVCVSLLWMTLHPPRIHKNPEDDACHPQTINSRRTESVARKFLCSFCLFVYFLFMFPLLGVRIKDLWLFHQQTGMGRDVHPFSVTKRIHYYIWWTSFDSLRVLYWPSPFFFCRSSHVR